MGCRGEMKGTETVRTTKLAPSTCPEPRPFLRPLNRRSHTSQRPSRAFHISFALLFALTGCQGSLTNRSSSPNDTAQASTTDHETLAKGVTHYGIQTGPATGIDIIAVDLATTNARLSVGAKDIRADGGAIVARAITPTQWVKGGALAAVNGGYFGEDHDTAKEIVGLLVQNGRVRHAAPALTGRGGNGLAPGHYVRSVFGLMPGGAPRITWAATDIGHAQTIRAYDTPTPANLANGVAWRPLSAIGCGPTLIHNGKSVVTDRSERLVSEGPLPRTFVAYDLVDGHPRHVAFGIANAATFDEITTELQDFFSTYEHTRAWAAMCFDGGSSTQMTYRIGKTISAPRETEVGVTDCLLVVPPRDK